MEFKQADPEFKQLEDAEVNELLNQPIYLRVAMINSRDGTPLVHPVWYYQSTLKKFQKVKCFCSVDYSMARRPPPDFI